jgi:hypothetical protein
MQNGPDKPQKHRDTEFTEFLSGFLGVLCDSVVKTRESNETTELFNLFVTNTVFSKEIIGNDVFGIEYHCVARCCPNLANILGKFAQTCLETPRRIRYYSGIFRYGAPPGRKRPGYSYKAC